MDTFGLEKLSEEAARSKLLVSEANKRFKISEQKPTIRRFEKEVPLQIEHLGLDQDKVRINSTTYRTKLIRHYPYGPPLEQHLRDNLNGGIDYDLDESGKRDKTLEELQTPGDIYFEPGDFPIRGMSPNQDGEMEKFKEQLEKDQRLLGNLTRFHELAPSEQSAHDVEQLRAKVKYWKARLNQGKPPFETQIKYAVLKNGTEESGGFEENKKLYEAKNAFMEELLGGRPTISVKELCVKGACGVLRLPPNLKLHIRELITAGNVASVLESLAPILDPKSFPLDKFTVLAGSNFKESVNHDHPLIKSAKHLELMNMNLTTSDYWYSIVLANENTKLEIKNRFFTALEFLYIMDVWIEKKRKIGSSAKFPIYEKEEVLELFKLLKAREVVEVTEVTDLPDAIDPREFYEQFHIPINSSSELCVECHSTKRYRKPRLHLYLEVRALCQPETWSMGLLSMATRALDVVWNFRGGF